MSGSVSGDAPAISPWTGRTFQGYQRQDGQVGTRNYWLVVPLVFCENRNILALREAFQKELGISPPQPYRRHVADLLKLYREGRREEIKAYEFSEALPSAPPTTIFPNLDGVRFLTHDLGCGGTRDDARTLCGLLAGYVHHPNVAGATVLSLGCQHAQADILRQELDSRDRRHTKKVLIFEQQPPGPESKVLATALQKPFLRL